MTQNLTAQDWKIILHDQATMTPAALRFLKAVYAFPEHEGRGKLVAIAMGYGGKNPAGTLNLTFRGFAKISKKYTKDFDERQKRRYKYYDIPFYSEDELLEIKGDTGFVWKLRPALVEALEEGGFVKALGASASPDPAPPRANKAPSRKEPLSKTEWLKVLADKKIMTEKLQKILEIVYGADGFSMSGGRIGKLLGNSGKNTSQGCNASVGAAGRKIAEIYDLALLERSDGSSRFWTVFFTGEHQDGGFVWTLRPELADALREAGFELSDAVLEAVAKAMASNPEKVMTEGQKRRVVIDDYARSTEARRKCIKAHGAACVVCGFDFGKKYGAHGAGYIHVHHVTPISKRGGAYKIDPEKDLVPVCPNCHAMIHHKGGLLSVDELKAMLT